MDEAEVLQAIGELAPALRTRTDETEVAGRLPEDLARGLARAGLFRLWTPRAVGGLELSPSAGLRAIEAAARADAAAGWLGMIASTSGIGGAFMDPANAREVFGRETGISCGVFASSGEAVETPEGYVVTGRWSWASGSRNADWIGAGCIVIPMAEGAPKTRRSVLFRPDQLTFADNWQVLGLSGSSSGDIVADGVLVPRDRVYSPTPSERVDPGPLFSIPYMSMLAMAVGAVHIGNLAALFDEVRGLALTKVPSMARKPLIERVHVQLALAHTEAELLAARALLHQAGDTLWALARAGGPIELEHRALARMAASHCATVAQTGLARLHELAGGSAVFLTSPVQRRLRDGMTMTQHAMTASGTWELIGRARAGLPGEFGLF